MSRLVLFLAQGFGTGRIRYAPGTWGSLVGLVWVLLLLATRNFWLYLAGTLFGIALSVCLCGAAEQILRQRDPGSVVIDEIAAMPICFLFLAGRDWFTHHTLPNPEQLFSWPRLILPLVLFGLFRAFDIVKPWPVHQSQALKGGWGVTMDDVLAAVYVALLTIIPAFWK